LEGGLGEEFGGVEDAAAGGDDLSTTSVDGVGVEGYVLDVETDTSHGFIGQTTFLGGPARVSINAEGEWLLPLEGSDARVLDFVQVLNSLGLINQEIGTGGIGTEAPDLSGVGDVPAVLVSEMSGTNLGIVSWAHFVGLNFD
jgi:hypothetical protein